MKLQRFHSVRSVFLLLSILAFIQPDSSKAGGDDEDLSENSSPSDPSELFSSISLDPARLNKLKDSLKDVDARSRSTETALEYLNMPLPPRDSIVGMIDALLDGKGVDRQRMLGIRILIARHKSRRSAPFSIPYGPSPYPASSLLPTWDTKRVAPYSRRVESRKKELRLVAPEWSCGFRIPVDGMMTSPYGLREGRQHVGVDIDLRTGDPVRAAFPGMVRVSRYFNGYGRVVIVRHYNGLETLYAHLNRSDVEPGERVEAGERIGFGGSTGHSTGSHLHFEVRYKGIPLNPSHFISFEKEKLMGDTLVLKKNDAGVASYPKGTEFHRVKRGDYLYRIAQRYGVSIHKLCEWNGIDRNAPLWVGQRLRVSH